VRLLQLPRKDLPHQTTYERVVEKLDEVEFERVVGDFFTSKRWNSFILTLDG